MATTFVSEPGTSGRYQSTDDVNLLDADTAHCYQAVGNKSSYASSVVNSTPQAVAAAWSGYGTQWTMTWAAYNGFRMGYVSPYFAVSPSTEYTFSFKADIPSEWGTTVRVRVTRDVAGATDHTVTRVDGAATYYNTFTTGASDANIKVQIDCSLSDGATSGTDTIEAYDICLQAGTSTAFVPSLRIVGGKLTVEAKVAVAEATPSAWGCFAHCEAGGAGWRLEHDDSGKLFWRTYVTGGDASILTSAVGWAPYEPFTIVATHSATEISAGKNSIVYVDGVEVGSVDSPDAAVTAGETAMVVGLLGSDYLAGNVFYVYLRDGDSSGPIVAEFLASDVRDAVA